MTQPRRIMQTNHEDANYLLASSNTQSTPKRDFCNIFATIMCIIVAILHVIFGLFESFLWFQVGSAVFGLTPLQVLYGASLAANQGFYNWMLVAGLIYACALQQMHLQFFFLLCVFCAAIVGALTAAWTILLVQGVPALIGILFLIPKMNKFQWIAFVCTILVSVVFGVGIRLLHYYH